MKNNGVFARNKLIVITMLKVIIMVVHCGGKQCSEATGADDLPYKQK